MCTASIDAFNWPVVLPALLNSGSIRLWWPSLTTQHSHGPTPSKKNDLLQFWSFSWFSEVTVLLKEAYPPEVSTETLEFLGNLKIPFGIRSVFLSVLYIYSSYEVHSHSNIQTVFRYPDGNPYVFTQKQPHYIFLLPCHLLKILMDLFISCNFLV